jgi:pimeloyl-ACP methyl ester carboxylesterase
VVVVHGFKGFKDWGFFPFVCDALAGAGHAVVSFNFSRNGVGSDDESFTDLDRFATNTLSLEQEELASVLTEVLEGDLVPRRPRRVGLLGHSRGGGQAVLAAAAEPRLAALVTWAAVSTFDRWSEETREEWRRDGRMWVLNQRTGQQMPLDVGLLEDFERNRERLDVPSAAARVKAPWLIVHGDQDLTVPPREASDLARAAPQARLTYVEGAGHTFEARHPFEGASAELRRAVDATLAHFERHLES